ncbi:MAG TPA: FKBP-type peptidyl-prolyl cis-trans isomerase, partial [Chitinophagaceae bacterium]
VDFKKTKGGMPYKIFSGKGTEKVTPGSIIKVQVMRKVNDSVLFDTRTTLPAYIPVENTSVPYDVSEIFTELKAGDSVYTVQMIDTFMARTPGQVPPQFKKGDRLISTFKILDVFQNEQEAQADVAKEQSAMFARDPKIQAQMKKDDVLIKDYLAKNNITAQRTGMGTYVEILTPGDGQAVEKGKKVSLKYTGKTFAGKVFDSNVDPSFKHTEPLEFIVDQSPMIKGFEEGLKELKTGSKARLYIPSALAFGENPTSPDILANENLIFDIEVLSVTDAPAAPTAPHSNLDTTQPKK